METALVVSDLEKEIESYLHDGYRLDMIMPADSPTTAQISKNGEILHLETSPRETNENFEPVDPDNIIITRFDDNLWVEGRAGMQYRDLIPSRLGGCVIASHIRLTKGGEVPDYVHYHKIAFQMIFCKTGWIRVVYEDQGPPFILNAGDCVLQPPEIRHRVIDSSAGAEVIEIGCPAVHETWVDHDMQLPTDDIKLDRIFNGQRFVRHIADETEWMQHDVSLFEARDIGIRQATNGIADVRILRLPPAFQDRNTYLTAYERGISFNYVLNGEITLSAEETISHKLRAEDCFVIPPGTNIRFCAGKKLEMLEIGISLDENRKTGTDPVFHTS